MVPQQTPLYQPENRDEAAHAGGRHKVIDNEPLDLIVMMLGTNNMRTLREIKEEVMEIFLPKPHFSFVTLSRHLEGKPISQTMPRDAPAERNFPAVKEAGTHWSATTGIH